MRIALASLLLISTLLVPAPAMAMTSAPTQVPTASTTMGFGMCILFPGLPWCPK